MMDNRAKIMLVDDDIVTLTVGKNMLQRSYEVYPLPSATKLFEILRHVTPDMILLDIEMPDMNGHEVIRRLRANKRFNDVPVIFVSAFCDENSELEGLNLGAIDYVPKPFSAPLLLKRIENHLISTQRKKELARYNAGLQMLIDEKTKYVFDLQNAVLATVADLVECRDDVTGGHVARTQKYLRLLIDPLLENGSHQKETSSWNMDFLISSAQLHDVGKIAVNDAILNKPGKLTTEEFEIMKTHVVAGIKAIKKIQMHTLDHAFLRHAEAFIAGHHEKWDGSGYPLGLRGYAISLEGRLMAIADVYDALISTRPYKAPLSPERATSIIIEGSGSHFDPALIEIFRLVEADFARVARNERGEPSPPTRPGFTRHINDPLGAPADKVHQPRQ
ncbi:MAG: response regulator [Desulfobulbaceae bacterium]|jgi:putative two-component system response regulator|nr:response regulator [Desulfobulbaceae bacterium]